MTTQQSQSQQASTTFASAYVRVGSSLIAAYVRSDGAVCTRVGSSVMDIDPLQTVVFTRGSVQSAVLKAGYNRIDHLSIGRVQSGGGWRLREWSLRDFVVAGPNTPDEARGAALWAKIVDNYAAETE